MFCSTLRLPLRPHRSAPIGNGRSWLLWAMAPAVMAGWLTVTSYGAPLTWLESLQEARSHALVQGKLVLLMAGRPTCSVCTYMKQSICESAQVRPIIDDAFVPWFANMDFSSDYVPYAAELGNFSLPLTCVIDPHTTNQWLLRLTGPYSAETYADYLRQGARRAPPWPTNLASGQMIHDDQFQVQGRLSSSLEPLSLYYRVGPEASPGGVFLRAASVPEWNVSLSGIITPGQSNRYIFEAYAAYSGGYLSRTNQVLFVYSPATPPPVPRFEGIRLGAGVICLKLTNLQAGATHQVLRSFDLEPGGPWTVVTTVVSTSGWVEVTDAMPPGRERGFYRLYREP